MDCAVEPVLRLLAHSGKPAQRARQSSSVGNFGTGLGRLYTGLSCGQRSCPYGDDREAF